MIAARKLRVHVRNKNRYDPETKERSFLYVEINDFAGTTIGDIKEDVRRQSRALRIDDLFLDNQSLADDRSVAHYNLEDGCILETTSNPFWVACLYIKASEVKQEMAGNPNDKHIQDWTHKSLLKKYVLIGLLLNSKNEYGRQPPHFATLDEFLIYLERLDKKGATMHPEYTRKDMRAFEREYRQEFLGRYEDPIAAFIDHHAVRLGHALPDEIDHRPNAMPRNVLNARNRPAAGKPNTGARRKQDRYCDDCEEALAEVYCAECQGGLAMCRRCSAMLHAGASRRRHTLQDIQQAPSTNSKPYVPRAFLAPFSIVLAMYSALKTEAILSMTEDEIKRRAQPLTDTDLQDKQAGKYVGGFDCMENVLMDRGFVKREAARVPTYALSASGQMLGERLYTFYTQFFQFMESCRLPKVHNAARNCVINNRKLCLIIDDNERDKQRLLRYASEKNIDAQVRLLPAGDYVWILTPPMIDPHTRYTGKDYGNELVLPFVVERKSWEDFENSSNSGRFRRQINNMLGCGLDNCFYLMEGSISGIRNNATPHHQQHLKGLLEKLVTENGFYVNYTASWMKSAQWLLWFTGFLIAGCKKGVFQEDCISYHEFMSRVARQRGNTLVNIAFRNARRYTHTWKAQLFVDHIIRDGHGERSVLSTVTEDIGVTNRTDKHLLVIQDLEQYNKKRQSALNKCCEAVYADPGHARDIVEDKLGPAVHNMLHYDIASYWQLYMQVTAGVYVVRTETGQDTENIHRIFMSTPSVIAPPVAASTSTPKATSKRATNSRKSQMNSTATAIGNATDNSSDSVPTFAPRRNAQRDPPVTNFNKNAQLDPEKHSSHETVGLNPGLDQITNSPFHDLHVGNEDNHITAGHVIKRGKRISGSDKNKQKTEYTAEHPTVQPFTGQGYCLGMVEAENGLGSIKTANRNSNTQYEFQRDSSDLSMFQQGLAGGMLNSRNNSPDKKGDWKGMLDKNEIGQVDKEFNGADKSVSTTDFVDSQNEDEIMKEILAKSEAEAKEMSNEDEMMKLAMEMSRQKSGRKTSVVTGNDSTDDELLLVLERSKTSDEIEIFKNSLHSDDTYEVVNKNMKANHGNQKNILNLSEEEQLKHVLEISKVDTERIVKETEIISQNKDELRSKENEDKSLNYAIQMSLRKASRSHGGIHKKFGPGVVEEEVIFIPNTEEEQVKLVLEMSKKETPEETITSAVKNRTAQRRPIKRKLTDSPENYDITKLSEEEQLKLAMELSDLQAANEHETSDKTERTRTGLKPEPDSVLKYPDKSITREVDNGASPCKKSKSNLNCSNVNRHTALRYEVEQFTELTDDVNRHVHVEKFDGENSDNENEDLKRAIEKSKFEHTPDKRFKVGNEFLDEDEVVKFVIERSKCEYTTPKKCDTEQSRKRMEGSVQSSLEIIEIDSQNSQNKGDDTFDFNGFVLSQEDDFRQASVTPEKSSDNWLNRGRKCSNVRNKANNLLPSVDVECDLAERDYVEHENYTESEVLSGSCDSFVDVSSSDKKKVESVGSIDFVGKDTTPEKCDLRDNFEDVEHDLIPPSPGRTCSTEHVSFSQSFFSKTPESGSIKSLYKISNCSSNRSYSDTQQDKSQSTWGTPTNSKNMKSECSNQENSDNIDVDASDATSNTDIAKHKKFDLKTSLFYDSDEYSSESELDIFEGEENVQNENQDSVADKDSFSGAKRGLTVRNFITENKGKTEEIDVLESSEVSVNQSFNIHIAREEETGQLSGSSVIVKSDILSQTDRASAVRVETNVQVQKSNIPPEDTLQSGESHLHPEDEYVDYDDDNDIDYQPDSQDMNVESESEGSSFSDLEENSQERNDLDLLPQIRRPRKIRYRQLKEEGERLYEIKKKEKALGMFKIDVGKLTADEIYARQVQEELDREANQKEENTSLIDDAYIARQLHETLNKEPASSDNGKELEDLVMRNRECNSNKYHPLQDTRKRTSGCKPVDTSVKCNSVESYNGSSKSDTSERMRRTYSGDAEALMMELQRKELEKIERWKKMLVEDEKLAQRLTEMQADTENEAASAASPAKTPKTSTCTQSQQTDTSFKRMVAQHKVSKEKALIQLQQYRNLQMKRFQDLRSRPHCTSLTANSERNTDHGHDNDVIIIGEFEDNLTVPPVTSYTNTETGVNSSLNRTQFNEYRNTSEKDTFTQAVNHENQSSIGHHKIQNDQSQTSNGDHMPHFNQSQPVDCNHMNQGNQSQSLGVKYSNVTCGNCGEKGHNRTFQKCPKYHSAEESARREAKVEKQRQQKEEKRRQEVETVHMLSEHQKMLEDMTGQIQREMGTLQNHLQQRTSELEAQVALRVKKIENKDKKKKR